jgi:UDP-N-acetylglucosamine 4-epimerase
MKYESPVINGDGTNSRDFTYIDNVIQMNMLTMLTDDVSALNTVYNTACGDRTNLKELVNHIKSILVRYDSKIEEVPIVFGPNRAGDIPHSLASIEKAKSKLGYTPEYTLFPGLEEAIKWYWSNLK